MSSNRAGCSSPTPTSWPNRATTSCCVTCRNQFCSCTVTTARSAPCSTRANIAAVRSYRTTPATPGGGWSAGTTPGPTTSTANSSVSRERRTSRSTRACLGLPPVRCEAWGSLVFVNLDGNAPPLLDALGAVGRDLHDQIGGGDGVGPVHLVGRRSIEVEGNWKLTVDANIETYHVNTVHRTSAAVVLDQAATGIFLFPDGHSQMLVHSRDDKTFAIDLPASRAPAPWRTAGSTRSTCSPTRASSSADRRRSPSSSPAGRSDRTAASTTSTSSRPRPPADRTADSSPRWSKPTGRCCSRISPTSPPSSAPSRAADSRR